ncbi:hypothetical protein AB0D12_35580, partial [Streptomyces sp. NPDC048479]
LRRVVLHDHEMSVLRSSRSSVSCVQDQGSRPYKQRNTVERCINRLKQWRGIATRYEKTATIYLAGLHIAGIFLVSPMIQTKRPS